MQDNAKKQQKNQNAIVTKPFIGQHPTYIHLIYIILNLLRGDFTIAELQVMDFRKITFFSFLWNFLGYKWADRFDAQFILKVFTFSTTFSFTFFVSYNYKRKKNWKITCFLFFNITLIT